MIKKLLVFLILLSATLLMPHQAQAMGDLTISPWRIAFEARDHSGAIELLNTSDKTHTYRIGWTLLKATKNGTYEQVFYKRDKDTDPHSVPNMVIISPKQVTIEPHHEQVVRLSVRRPADLPPGEYRAHMTFIRMADNATPVQDPKAKTISMQINVNLGFSVPIIIRQGEDKNLKVELQHPKLELNGGQQALKIDLTRLSGTFSTYGEVHVYWNPPKGSEKEIGMLNNVALYPEVKTRNLVVPITTKDNISGGTIRVAYTGKYESDGTTWDEKKFPVGAAK
jgi:fimbrial chaperone protein